MTLEEQIRPHTRYWDCYNDEPELYNHTGKILKITENFAIDFAEWLRENYYDNRELWTKWNSNDDTHSSKELLKIYKKEKGL